MPERPPVAGVLDEKERITVEQKFGVSAQQVIRDHAISHALAAIAAVGTESTVFFGGTALSRTLLPNLRLSEDIDLFALADRRALGRSIQTSIERRFQRSLGAATFTPPLGATQHPDPSMLAVRETRIQVQLISSEGYPPWPTELVDIVQRYSDAPPARLRVLIPAAFVASKLIAWCSRHAPRDLYDLWALAQGGWIDAEAARLYGRYGQHTSIAKVSFASVPSLADWQAQLAHQCVIASTPEQAAQVVRDAISTL